MKRREFLKSGSVFLTAGTTVMKTSPVSAAPQGREFRPAPPIKMPEKQRLIDLHVHPLFALEKTAAKPEFPPLLGNSSRADGVAQANISWDQFRSDMKQVEKAVILHVARDDGRKGNDNIAAIARRWPEKLVPFGSVNPLYPNALEEFQRMIKELGFKGCKMSPVYQKFHAMDPSACRIYAQAQEWGVPVMFHTATAQAPDVPLRYADPIPFDDVAYAFPRLKIIMAHWGHPWQREVTMVARKHPNVYIDISANFYHPWALYNALITAIEWNQTEKLFFATDYPVATANEQIEGLRKLNRFAQGGNPRIPDEVIEGIIHRDSLSSLGIDA